MKKNFYFDQILKFFLPFLALLISYYIFKITDWIIPLNEIKSTSIQWAIDLSFNTSIMSLLYELIKHSLIPNHKYEISIRDLKTQNNVALDYEEAQSILKIKCMSEFHNS